MARTTIHVAVEPERVFGVLADPFLYPQWVVGCKEVRRVDGDWPELGATFHHSVGLGPINVRDSTSVVESQPAQRLVLHARARPTGVARVELDLAVVGGGTRVAISERPIGGPPALLHNPIQDWFIDRRNRDSLRRLKRLAEER
jgi:uncharacterized protein YndB with AHSA1/START domain